MRASLLSQSIVPLVPCAAFSAHCESLNPRVSEPGGHHPLADRAAHGVCWRHVQLGVGGRQVRGRIHPHRVRHPRDNQEGEGAALMVWRLITTAGSQLHRVPIAQDGHNHSRQAFRSALCGSAQYGSQSCGSWSAIDAKYDPGGHQRLGGIPGCPVIQAHSHSSQLNFSPNCNCRRCGRECTAARTAPSGPPSRTSRCSATRCAAVAGQCLEVPRVLCCSATRCAAVQPPDQSPQGCRPLVGMPLAASACCGQLSTPCDLGTARLHEASQPFVQVIGASNMPTRYCRCSCMRGWRWSCHNVRTGHQAFQPLKP